MSKKHCEKVNDGLFIVAMYQFVDPERHDTVVESILRRINTAELALKQVALYKAVAAIAM